MDATYTKLRSGAWGLRVPGTVAPGDTIAVTTRAGKTELRTVGRVVWSNDTTTLCTIAGNGGGAARPARRRYAGSGRKCPQCGGHNPYGDPCSEPCD